MKTVIRNSYTPKTGDYCETIVVDKETNDAYIFDCDGVFTPMPQPVDVEDILRRAAEYTDETVAPLEEKLDTIEEGAQVNVIETITQNGQPLTVTDKTVNVTVPTKTSDLENDGSDGTDTYVESSTLDDYYTKSETNTQIGYETDAREIADAGLQEQIDAIVASSDVVDIVGTYAALQAYDTSKLHDNDIIKVLTDETRDDATTYYRWDADTSTWSYIGAEGPFYTKAESDALFTPMTRTINNKALTTDITLTAADVHALPDSTVIPTVNDATLTIQKNGTDVAIFTANSASNQTANITVPTDTSDLNNDGDGQSPFATEDYVDLNGGKIDTIEVNGTAQPIVNKTVDITVPTRTSDLTNDGDGNSTYVETDDLGAAAFSNQYADLDGLPTIPTVNDATLTIQKNGTDVATFTANSATNQTANITVPVNTSDLTNDSGFITSSALSNYYTKNETYSQGEVNSLINNLDIPTATSDLTNDSGFITLTDIPTASANDLGVIRIGTGLSIDQDGIVSVASAGSVDWDDVTNRPTNVSYWTNDAGYITSAAIPTNVSSFTNDAGYITSAAIPTNVSAFTNDAGYITNSALGNYYTKSQTYSQQEVNALINTIAVPTKTSDLTNDGADGTSTYVEADELGAAAFSNSFNDLTDKPTIGNATITIQKNGASAGTFTTNATANKSINITVPTKTSDITNDSGFITGIPTASASTLGGIKVGDNLSIDANGVLSADAESITVDSALSTSSPNPVQNSVITAALNGKANSADLSAVATSGSYNDLSNKPTIPTVNNGTLTIQKNGTTVQTFTANQSSNATANITVPIVDSSLSSTSTNAVENKAVTTKINEIDRFYRGLVPLGTAIAANKNLNTTEFLKVGKYYCSTNATVATLTNCPTGTAFMMEVFSPLSTTIDNETTGTWVYRMRLITELDGDMWYQGCNSNGTANNWTYNAWHKVARIADIDAKPNSYWGTCSTAAATAAKVVTVSSSQNFKLVPGAMVTFKAPNTNTAQNPTINVNSTGAKPVFFNSGVVTTGNLNKAGQNGRPATYVYDGTNWVWVSWSADDNTTYSAMSVAEGQAGTATSARTMRADYLKQIIQHYNPTVNDATLTIQKNGTNVQTFTANSATNKTANIQVPNLQTSNTDPGEGSALAADTFLGIYDIAPEDVDGARLVDATVTAAKLAGKAKIALEANASGSFAATDKGVLIVDEQFQNYSSNADTTARISFSGASGTTVTPTASQRSGINYTRAHVFGLALVDAGDSVSWTTTYSNAGIISNGGFSLFIPCNW